MVRLECWEYWGGYWVICTETVRTDEGPVVRRRLGAVQVPARPGDPKSGMDMLAMACELGLDIAYARWEHNLPTPPLGPGLNSPET